MTRIPRALAIALWPVSIVYGLVVRAKNWMYDAGWLKARRLRGTVISVGNLTTGGTGKTPMVLWLAERFLAEGKSVAILSRGYKGSGGTSDEIELLRRRLGRAFDSEWGRTDMHRERSWRRSEVSMYFCSTMGFSIENLHVI